MNNNTVVSHTSFEMVFIGGLHYDYRYLYYYDESLDSKVTEERWTLLQRLTTPTTALHTAHRFGDAHGYPSFVFFLPQTVLGETGLYRWMTTFLLLRALPCTCPKWAPIKYPSSCGHNIRKHCRNLVLDP